MPAASVGEVIEPTRLPAAAPRRVAERLRAAPDGPLRVLHRGPYAAYVEVGGWCVGVVWPGAVAVPCALRLAAPLPGAPQAPRTAWVRGGVLHLDGVPVVVGRLLDVAVARLAPAASGPIRPPGPSSAPFDAPVGRRRAGLAADPDLAASRLVGAGGGLTPYGDDVLCGWLAVHRAAGVATPSLDEAVRRRLHRTTLLSATLLDCAMAGEAVGELVTWLTALGTPAEPVAATALAGVGHTSGRGLLAGARQALAELATAPRVAA